MMVATVMEKKYATTDDAMRVNHPVVLLESSVMKLQIRVQEGPTQAVPTSVLNSLDANAVRALVYNSVFILCTPMSKFEK
jgi:hypothetical protein